MIRDTTPAAERPRASALRVGAALGAVVLAAVVVFGLGVMVGKRVAESAPAVAVPPTALTSESAPPMAAPGAPAAATASETLTFYDRLSGVTTAAPVALPDGETPRAPARPTPSADLAPQAPRTSQQQPPAPIAVATRTPGAAAKPKPSSESAAARIRKLAGKGRYVVQVASVSDRSAAEAAAARVRSDGFDALTVMVSIKGRTWYRIRTGRFPNKQAAIKAAGIFSSVYGFKAIAIQD